MRKRNKGYLTILIILIFIVGTSFGISIINSSIEYSKLNIVLNKSNVFVNAGENLNEMDYISEMHGTLKIIDKVDYTKAGTYNIIYEVYNSSLKKKTAILKVIVK